MCCCKEVIELMSKKVEKICPCRRIPVNQGELSGRNGKALL